MYKFVCAAAIAVTALGCGSSSNSEPNIAAFQVSYEKPYAMYYLGVPITPNIPHPVGETESYSISPPLPIGLAFDETSGVISGQPEGIAPNRRYTITALGEAAVAKTDVNIGIVYPPRFAFVANEQDSTISAYTMDPTTGELRHRGYMAAPETAIGPADLLTHPSGDFFFAVNHDSRTISVYSLDPISGAIVPLSTAGEGTSANEMVLHPNGRFLYVTSLFTSRLRTYEFDATTGTLSQVGDPLQTTPVIADLEIHPTGGFLSLTNRWDGVIHSYALDPTTGLPTLLSTAPVNSLASSIAFSKDGKYAYVTAENFQLLVRFRVDPLTGEFTDPRTKPTGESPKFVKLHPSGRFVYVVNTGSDTLTKYEINPVNGLPLAPTIVPTGFSPQRISFDPGGNFAYVMNGGSADLSVYHVDLTDGSLHIAESMRARAEPRAMIMAQGPLPVLNEAQFVYVVNEESGDVASYSSSPSTGELTEIGLAPLAGTSPTAIVADPHGRFVYVANSGSGDITSFQLNPVTGSLNEIGLPTANGAETNAIAIEPSGRFLFATARGASTVSAYRIDSTTGELSFLQTEPTTAPNPVSVAVDPTGRFLYVVNSGIDGDPDNSGDVSVFRIDPRLGSLTLELDGGVQGGSPSAITFSRSGRFAYVPLGSGAGVVAASVNFESGSLAGVVQDVQSQSHSLAIEVDPAGQFAYSAVRDELQLANRIDILRLSSSGTMVPLESVVGDSSPVDLAVDPSGNFLYAVNQVAGDISIFEISKESGELSLITRSTTGLQPRAVTIVGTVK